MNDLGRTPDPGGPRAARATWAMSDPYSRPKNVRRLAGTRALSPISSIVVVVVVLAMLGVVAYGVLGGFTPASPATCQPANSPLCGQFANLHDVTLIVPFQSVQQGASVPVTAKLPVGETASQYTFNYGDGSKVAPQPSGTASHIFRVPGVYLVSVQASVGGLLHDNYAGLVQMKVTSSALSNTNDSLPSIAGSVLTNSSAVHGGPAPTAVLGPGGTVTLSVSYTSSPTNPLWRDVPPHIAVPSGGTVVSSSASSVNATSTIRFQTPGTYLVTGVGGSTNLTTNSTTPVSYQNFTWTVFVAPTGTHAGVVGLYIPRSPHPGTIISYELAPGGARTEDPAIAYDTVSYEPIANVYQPLISYNGSAVGPNANDFIPVLATCVPGSAECQSLYAAPLVSADGANYTFVLSSAAQFYDAKTGASWGVYPTDVLFSITRTLAYSTLPCVSCNNGWILAQSLLSGGNGSWDSIHQAYNNTPSNILDSMQINDTSPALGAAACPAVALQQDHGCITFHAWGNHHVWPYFLELIADPLGGSIVPCGWYSAQTQGAGIPYWTAGNSSGAGDHPCAAPGTNGYGIAPAQIPAQGWDQWETIGSGATGRFQGNVQYSMVGTGPYYLSQYSVGLSYSLAASPAYKQNPDCTWSTCWPAPGSYAKNIQVTWETEATPGEQALAAGVADFAGIPSTDLSLQLQLIAQGKINALSAPTLQIGFTAFDMQFSVPKALQLSTQPVSVQSDFFSYLGMRQFFARAYPYTTIQNTINTKDGIQLSFNYGGAIPQFMGNYYPGNISWPSQDPSAACAGNGAGTPACPSWWWQQMHASNSPYYDPEVASCSASSPCQVPLFGTTGNPTGDTINNLWATQVNQLSQGAIIVNPIDVNFVTLLIEGSAPATQNAFPFFGLGWAPDYPDPTDYVQPLYLENSTYTYSDAVAQSLYTPQFSQGCQPASDYSYYANLAMPVAQSCQGVAYKSMVRLLEVAGTTPAGPERVLLYNMAEHIASQLALYVYTSQANLFGGGAAWININSINTNPTLGAGGALPFFWLTGNGLTST
jgi:peptide/nickel transport system substrate-binding protein